MKEVTLMAMLKRLIEDYTNYSELVALNYDHKREKKSVFDEGTLQWNRGHKDQIETYMQDLADLLGVELEFQFGPHSFGFGDWKRTLEYRTVRIKEF